MNSDQPIDPAQALSHCLIFQALEADGRAALVKRAKRRPYRPGETIFAMGSPGNSLMIVLRGEVRITLPSVTAKLIVLADLGPGAVFGEIAMLDGRARSADATALTACELLVCERRDILPFLEGHWETCFRLLQMLCGRLRVTDTQMADIAFFELPERLAKTLLDKAVPYRGGAEATPVGRLSATQSELAHMVGGTRESVNRCLAGWRRAGIVEIDRGRILLRRPDVLRRLADGL